jgi:TP53 regulating kinase and related kinases
MPQQKILAQGAEAIIYLEESRELINSNAEGVCGWEGTGSERDSKKLIIVKDRIAKSYRIPELDSKIRKSRTKAEAKLLDKVSKIIPAPQPEEIPKAGRIIRMPFIDGQKLSDHLDSFPLTKQKQILKQIGKNIAKIHEAGIIHGDLTTSNMILVENQVFLIDFGLGYQNGKYEDKAVDIHLLKQALEAKHFKHWEATYKEFESGYSSINKTESKKVFERLKAVEKRGRYKH